MQNLIDYAGLFPPAKLSLDRAIREYSEYIQGKDAWMLSRFICPSNQLYALKPLMKLFESKYPLILSVLTRGGETWKEYFTNFKQDLKDIEIFINEFGEVGKVEVIETKLPVEVYRDINESGHAFLQKLLSETEKFSREKIQYFVEANLNQDWQSSLPKIITSMAEFNWQFQSSTKNQSGFVFGFKIRSGGVDASAFPSISQLTATIRECIEANIPLKATAGLHHPIRHYNESIETRIHGFINVFGAALLAVENKLEQKEIQTILGDENSDHFIFEENYFHWGNFKISTASIQQLREALVISFGSCSFDEPREDLRAMGLLI
jgi:hypothetical protein